MDSEIRSNCGIHSLAVNLTLSLFSRDNCSNHWVNDAMNFNLTWSSFWIFDGAYSRSFLLLLAFFYVSFHIFFFPVFARHLMRCFVVVRELLLLFCPSQKWNAGSLDLKELLWPLSYCRNELQAYLLLDFRRPLHNSLVYENKRFLD